MPISFPKTTLQRQENRYQNRRTKNYLEEQKFLKELQTHPDLLPRPSHPQRSPATWQQFLLLSSLFATLPIGAKATTPSASAKADAHNHGTQAHSTSQPSAAPPPYTSTPSPPLSNLRSPARTALTSSALPCHTVLACFTDFLRDAGPRAQTKFAHLLHSHSNNLASLSKQLSQTFPSLANENTYSSHHIKKKHRRRHLESIHEPHISTPAAPILATSSTNLTSSTDLYAQTKARLESWVNATQAERVITSPTSALGAVLHHYGASLSHDFLDFLNSTVLDTEDRLLIDEAAQLYQQTHADQFYFLNETLALNHHPINDIAIQHSPSLNNTNEVETHELIRNHFLEILIPDLKKEIWLKDLLAPVINGTDAEFFFDGIALRGAFGKNFETLLLSPDLKKVKGFAELTADKQREILKEKFERVGEDTFYKIGTTAHSLASTIQRILKYQHRAIPEKFDNEKLLFKAFYEIENRWETHRDYPLHPRLAFSEHLAHASNVKVQPSNWREQLWFEDYLPFFTAANQEISLRNPEAARRSLIWLASYFAHWNQDGQSWSSRGEAITRDVLDSLFKCFQDISQAYYVGLPTAELKQYIEAQKFLNSPDLPHYKTALERLAESIQKQSRHTARLKGLYAGLLKTIYNLDHYLRQEIKKTNQERTALLAQIEKGEGPLPTGQPPDLIIWLAKHMVDTALSSEMIIGQDWRSQTAAVLQYANERLLANYGTAPNFDRTASAFAILKKQGLSDAQITLPRRYTLQHENMHLSESKYGSLLDEFLVRADSSGLTTKTLYISTLDGEQRRIYPQNELQAAEDQYNQNLPFHPWVRARARENCRVNVAPHTALSEAAINAEAQRIARNYVTETEDHRHLMVGLETWINTIPLIGPIYNIEEGIRHKETAQILLGSFFLALDTFDLATGGRPRTNNLAVGEALDNVALRLPPIEHLTAGSIHHMVEELDFPITDLDVSASTANPAGISFNNDPWNIALDDANIPLDYRSLATQVRSGNANAKWIAPNDQEFDVIRIANEDRIVPVQHRGGKFQEISWEDGEPLYNTRLIHYDHQAHIYFSAKGLKGGGRPSGDLRIEGERLSRRYTTARTVSILNKARNTQTLQSIATIFSQRFPISPTSSTATTFPAHAFYTEIYGKSPTFRRLANYFFKNPAASAASLAKWQIQISERARPYVNQLNIERTPQQLIAIPDDAHIANLHYLGVDGWHTFTREQVYLDAIITAMTGKADIIAPMPVTTRGPNITLRDRILFEAAYNLPQQTTYSRVTTAERDSGRYDSFNPNPETHRAQANTLLTFENSYLDPLFDEKIALTAETEVLGTPLSERYTVKQLQEIQSLFSAKAPSVIFDKLHFSAELKSSFDFSSMGLSEQEISDFNIFYKFLYKRSPTFRQLWIRAHIDGIVDSSQRWKFATDPIFAEKNLPLSRKHSTVDLRNHIIYILPDNTYYLSERGFIKVEIERKLTHAMLNVLTRAHEPVTDIWINRGALVHLAEKILTEADFSLATRLAYGLVSGEHIRSGQFRGGFDPRVYQTTAQRARSLEERYIQSVAFKEARFSPRSSSDSSYTDLRFLAGSDSDSF